MQIVTTTKMTINFIIENRTKIFQIINGTELEKTKTKLRVNSQNKPVK